MNIYLNIHDVFQQQFSKHGKIHNQQIKITSQIENIFGGKICTEVKRKDF